MAASDQRYLVFKYPKKSWTVFSRQNDAIECASKNSDQKVFALEISREARTFLVCDVDNFWKSLKFSWLRRACVTSAFWPKILCLS